VYTDGSPMTDSSSVRVSMIAGGKRMQDLIDASAAAAYIAEIDAPGAWEKG
jgi:hypothetical protein